MREKGIVLYLYFLFSEVTIQCVVSLYNYNNQYSTAKMREKGIVLCLYVLFSEDAIQYVVLLLQL